MNIPKEIIIDALKQIYTSFSIKPNQINITKHDNFIHGTWIDEYGDKVVFEIILDKDFARPQLVIANKQFSHNNNLYQLLITKQPTYWAIAI